MNELQLYKRHDKTQNERGKTHTCTGTNCKMCFCSAEEEKKECRKQTEEKLNKSFETSMAFGNFNNSRSPCIFFAQKFDCCVCVCTKRNCNLMLAVEIPCARDEKTVNLTD